MAGMKGIGQGQAGRGEGGFQTINDGEGEGGRKCQPQEKLHQKKETNGDAPQKIVREGHIDLSAEGKGEIGTEMMICERGGTL